MLYQQICFVGLTLYATLSRKTFGSTYYAYTSNTAGCSGAGPGDHCIFLCDTDDWKQDFDCGNAGICDITCDEKQCLHASTVTASNSFQLNVLARRVGGEEKCYKKTKFSLPNSGSANFSATASSIDPFQEIVVNAGSNTKNIYINCAGGNKIDECKKITVNAQTADFLYINIADSILKGDQNRIATVNCPQNPSYSGPYDAPCYIDAHNAVLQYVTINTQYGMPHDVIIDASDATSWLEVALTCWSIDNTLHVLNTDILNEFNGCWSTRAPTSMTYSPTSAPTGIPTTATNSPTPAPTLQPTPAPTFNPTAAPTPAPTHVTTSPTPSPTPAPTPSPTPAPTLRPTNKPTVSPSKSPTRKPSLSPSKYPTQKPSTSPTTAVPTATPTRHPSTVPTPNPSSGPSVPPTKHPSRDPTPSPSFAPIVMPSKQPTEDPTLSPSHPTKVPTEDPTLSPSHPTEAPVGTVIVIGNPTVSPSDSVISVSETKAMIEPHETDTSERSSEMIGNLNTIFTIILFILIVLIIGALVFICWGLVMWYRHRRVQEDPKEIHISHNTAFNTNYLTHRVARSESDSDRLPMNVAGKEHAVVIRVQTTKPNVELQQGHVTVKHNDYYLSDSDDDVVKDMPHITARGGGKEKDTKDSVDDEMLIGDITIGNDKTDDVISSMVVGHYFAT